MIIQPKDIAYTLPPGMARPLMERSLEIVNRQKKEKKILQSYFLPGTGGSVFIGEFNTAEEITRNLNDAPMRPFLDVQLYPLDESNDGLEISVERVKEAEKMAQRPPR